MTDRDQPYDPPQDSGPPDQVETDPAALTSAEDLDEDRLRVDPLEAGMDPPERWSAADRRGTTPWEDAHSASLDERLAEEQPDDADSPPDTDDEADEALPPDTRSYDDERLGTSRSYDESLGTSADVAGGSVSRALRRPPPAE